MKNWFERHLKWINRVLLALIILINGYILVTPFLPKLQYHIAQATSEPLNIDNPDDLANIDRTTDHLLIPRLRLDQHIWYGDNPNLVHKGVWHVPGTSTPDQGSNSVLVGHRFTYKDPAVFYNLDQVQMGDSMVAVWDGKVYVYKVTAIDVVPENAIQVHNPSVDNRLTVYTCTPIWSNKDRLVLTGTLEKTL